MKQQLTQYVNLLFAGTEGCEDIKQEILQNTMDRYEDLIAEGKSPEAAYRLAILGIGDISEILGNAKPASWGMPPVQDAQKRKKTPHQGLTAIAIALYILALIPLLLIPGRGGLSVMVVLIAIATALLVLRGKNEDSASTSFFGKLWTLAAKHTVITVIVCVLAAIMVSSVLGALLFGSFGTAKTTVHAVTAPMDEAAPTRFTEYTVPAREEPTELPATQPPEVIHKEDPSYGQTGTATNDVNVRATPSQMAPNIGMLKQGETVEIGRTENIEGKVWGYILSPMQGWVVMEYVQIEDPAAAEAYPVTPENTFPVQNPDLEAATFSPSEVSRISIDWRAGSVTIEPYDGDLITVSETGTSDTLHAFQYSIRENGKLSIDFCEKNLMQTLTGANVKKHLTIQVPKDWNCKELELEMNSSDLTVSGLTATEADLDIRSGSVIFQDCDFGKLEADSASADVEFGGTLKALEFDSTSGSFTGKLASAPSKVEMESTSGSLNLTLPQNTGFTLRREGPLRKFTYDFDVIEKQGTYVHGDGSCQIEVELASGAVTILKGE